MTLTISLDSTDCCVVSSLLLSHGVSRGRCSLCRGLIATESWAQPGSGDWEVDHRSPLHCITPWLPPLAAIIAGLLHINHRNGKMQGKCRANKQWHCTAGHISRWSLIIFSGHPTNLKPTTSSFIFQNLLEKVRSNIKRWGSAISQAGKWATRI